ncbi:hypothetical protein ACA910_014358 [Epithemia clementina (nom. ined.)]
MLEHSEVDRLVGIAAVFAFLCWLSLLLFVYTVTPASDWTYLEGVERQAPLLAAIVLSTSLFMLCMPFLNILKAGQRTSRPSGVVFAAVMTMIVAIITNILLSCFPTAVMIDPVMGARVFLLRWCEWIPLAGLMTFMSDVVDTENATDGLVPPLRHSIGQFLSSLCGIVFPFCPGVVSWTVAQIFAVSFYLPIFARVEYKRRQHMAQLKGISLVEKEIYDRRYFSYHLLNLCAWIWTVLVVMYFVHALVYYYQSPENPWVHPSSAMVVDTMFDILAKSLYLKVIVTVHHDVFDSDSRARAQLGELRRLMQLLWDSTTDTIIISVCGGEETSTFLSPSYQSFVGSLKDSDSPPKNDHAPGVLLQTTSRKDGCDTLKVLNAKYIDSSHISSSTSIDKLTMGTIDPEAKEVQLAAQMVHSCWKRLEYNPDGASLLVLQEFDRPNGETSYCELKVSQKSPGSFVAIIRDVTERHKRFEAEKRAHAEALARQKDAQNVNRFTRHEIKNGLLSGIELCIGLQKALDQVSVSGDDLKVQVSKMSGMIVQVDSVLHEILDTVLAEAMARDVIHECYEANPKKADLVDVLRSSCSGIGIEPRFPLRVAPSEDLPKLLIDTQLMRFIHRNAVSNASKYGKPGGTISTNIHYQIRDEMLTLEVVNEPGPGHNKLLDMGEKASKVVFEAGTRLHTDGQDIDDSTNSLSAGDGAWIMQKCAKTMGGICTISFEIDRTVFRLKCPVTPVVEEKAPDVATFHLPLNSWALGIDDSWIQRKQLVRILSNAGIDESRMRVIGKSLEELDSTVDLISEFLHEDPSSRGLILVDENLDYSDDCGSRVIRSGSKMMEQILQKIPSGNRDRILVLVRSANDSTDDVALYTKRTHGFFPKTATRKDDIFDSLEPAWKNRFGQPRPSIKDVTRDSQLANISPLQDDLREVVSSVDQLLQGRSCKDVPWPHLWSALHSLKGDIMITDQPQLKKASDAIGDMRGPEAPEDCDERWAAIRESIMEGIACMGDY